MSGELEFDMLQWSRAGCAHPEPVVLLRTVEVQRNPTQFSSEMVINCSFLYVVPLTVCSSICQRNWCSTWRALHFLNSHWIRKYKPKKKVNIYRSSILYALSSECSFSPTKWCVHSYRLQRLHLVCAGKSSLAWPSRFYIWSLQISCS